MEGEIKAFGCCSESQSSQGQVEGRSRESRTAIMRTSLSPLDSNFVCQPEFFLQRSRIGRKRFGGGRSGESGSPR